MVDYIDDLVGTLGASRKQVTSTFRTQAQQDALRASGATQTRHSTHQDGDALDYVPSQGQSPDGVAQTLNQAGYGNVHVLDETKPGMGTGPHYHISGLAGHPFLPGANPVTPNPVQVAASTVPQTDSTTSASAVPAANYDPLNPFGQEPTVKNQVVKLAQAGQAMGDVITNVDGQLQTQQAAREANLAKTVTDRNALLADQDAQTKELAATVTPIFARRAALAQRQVEIQDMNPIKRAVLGIFNRNYDPGHIKAVDDALVGELQEAGNQFATTSQIRDSLIKSVETRQQGQDAIDNLHETGLVQDKAIATDGWQIAHQALADSMLGLQSGEALTAAKVQQKSQALAQMTTSDLNSAMAQAKANKGFATVNGIALSQAEIQNRIQQQQGQDLSLEGQRISVQSGKQGLQDHFEQNLVNHMSYADLQTAAANGGVFRGVKLPSMALTQALAGYQARSQGFAQESLTTTSPQTYVAGIDRLNQVTTEQMRRLGGLFGSQMPAPYLQFTQDLVARSNQWAAKIHAATDPQAKAMIQQQALQDMSARQAQSGQVIQGIIQGMTKDKDAQTLLNGWATGVQPTGAQTTAGLIALYKGGGALKGIDNGPGGVAYRAGLKAYQAAVQELGGEKSWAEITAGGGKITKDEANRRISAAVSGAVSNAYNNGLWTQTSGQLPSIARQLGHPAAGIRGIDITAAEQVGDQTAYGRIASELGITSQQATDIFRPGGSKAAGYAAATQGKQGVATFDQANKNFATLSNTAMLHALDASPSAKPGFIPSHALVDLMNSNGFQSYVGKQSMVQPHTNLGNFIGDSVSEGNYANIVGLHAQGLRQAAGAAGTQAIIQNQKRVASYGNDPLMRTNTILASQGINAPDRQLLLHALTTNLSQTGQPMAGGQVDPVATADRVDSLILHTKFQDPTLERIRQRAAKDWTSAAQQTDAAINSAVSYKPVTGALENQ